MVGLREQVRDNKVEALAAEISELKARMALLEANSGVKVLREVEERKSRESNLVFYRIPEVDRAERTEVGKEEDEKRVKIVLKQIGITTAMKIEFSRRIGER